MTTDPVTRLLDSAEAAFVSNGYGAANLGTIARDAGSSKKTIYRYVESKEAPFGAVVERAIREAGSIDHLKDVSTVDGSSTDYEGELRDFLLAHARLTFSGRGIRTHSLVVAEAARFPELARIYEEVNRATVVGSLERWIKRRITAGVFTSSSAEHVGFTLLGSVFSYPLYRVMIGLDPAPDDETIVRIVEDAVKLALFGLMPRDEAKS